MPTTVLLATLNARYQHASLGLRYLYANLGEFKSAAEICEFTLHDNPVDVAESLLKRNPQIVGFGVYIWNVAPTLEVVAILKRVRPGLIVVLGGPEVSYEYETQTICQLADYTFLGEGEAQLYQFCKNYFDSEKLPPTKWISGPLPDVKKLTLPYSLYTADDVKNRVIYVEASRGCPYKCEFCLSSLDQSVRNFELDQFLDEMGKLIDRGVRQLKFVDRTFNLSIATSTRILEYFLPYVPQGLFLHFELVPDRLPDELKSLIARYPPGSLQFEIGIQTWDLDVSRRISRRQNFEKTALNFKFLKESSHAHLHADLIVGLPGETLESFALGFNSTAQLHPHEIQVGILKRLKGTPISRHDGEWEMVYSPVPPFQILQTKTMPFITIQALARFSKFWDLYANSGNFGKTLELMKDLAVARATPSWFAEFFEFTAFLNARHPQRHSIALVNLVKSAWIYLTEERGADRARVREALVFDYSECGKRDVPDFLREAPKKLIPSLPLPGQPAVGSPPERQRRHRREPAVTQSV